MTVGRRAAFAALFLAVFAAGTARGAVTWDEHETVDGVRWTARATGRGEFELGSDRDGVRALPPDAAGAVKIPSPFKDGQVTVVGKRALAGMEGLTEVVLPEGVREIGEEAFAGCTGLERVVLPESLLQIHARAFKGCRSLSTLELPGRVYNVEEEAFADCTGLGTLVVHPAFPDAKDIWLHAFSTLQLYDGAPSSWPVSFERRIFAGCTALATVRSARRLEFWNTLRISRGSFCGNDLPFCDPVDVFAGCGTVREVVLFSPFDHDRPVAEVFPDAAAALERAELAAWSPKASAGLFRGCAALETGVLPGSVEEIGDGAFAGCGNLKEVVVPERLAEGAWTNQLPPDCRMVVRGEKGTK
jgi:hypothetical protein